MELESRSENTSGPNDRPRVLLEDDEQEKDDQPELPSNLQAGRGPSSHAPDNHSMSDPPPRDEEAQEDVSKVSTYFRFCS